MTYIKVKVNPFTNQHIVPICLLNKWCNSEGYLYQLKRIYSEFEVSLKRPSSVGYRKKLLNFHYRKDVPEHYMESEIFGNVYDNQGGAVLDTILKQGINNIDESKCHSWARFVASLIVRNPEVVENKFRNQGHRFKEILLATNAPHQTTSSLNKQNDVLEYIEETYPKGYVEDIGLTIMPDVIELSANRIREEMEWALVNIGTSGLSFLIGDHPVILTANTADINCLIALPISPYQVFLASRPTNLWKNLTNCSATKLVKAVNYETVKSAHNEVFSINESQKEFVKKHLKG